MHKNGRKYFSCHPQFSGSKFPSDSRGDLRFAVGRRLAGLLDENVRHTIGKKVVSGCGQTSCHRCAKFALALKNSSQMLLFFMRGGSEMDQPT